MGLRLMLSEIPALTVDRLITSSIKSSIRIKKVKYYSKRFTATNLFMVYAKSRENITLTDLGTRAILLRKYSYKTPSHILSPFTSSV